MSASEDLGHMPYRSASRDLCQVQVLVTPKTGKSTAANIFLVREREGGNQHVFSGCTAVLVCLKPLCKLKDCEVALLQTIC